MRKLDPSKVRYGKTCERHPELSGMRFICNSTCVGCSRDAARAAHIKRRDESGKPPAIRYTKEEAKERIRARDRARGAIRRMDPNYKKRMLELKRIWRKNNREKYLHSSREYDRRMMSENLQRRVSKNLRHRVSKVLKGIAKSKSTMDMLGISFDGFRTYMESLFSEGMTWDNYGEWHIDHIKPLALFDLSIPDQQLLACHYTNLQPLWAKDNIAKGKRYE